MCDIEKKNNEKNLRRLFNTIINVYGLSHKWQCRIMKPLMLFFLSFFSLKIYSLHRQPSVSIVFLRIDIFSLQQFSGANENSEKKISRKGTHAQV